MKPEKEFMWMLELLNSKYTKGLFKTSAGCKKDFERLLKAPENSKEFNEWINGLIEQGIIEYVGKVTRENNGVRVEGYVVNSKELEKKLKENPLHSSANRYFERNRVL